MPVEDWKMLKLRRRLEAEREERIIFQKAALLVWVMLFIVCASWIKSILGF